MEITTWQTFSSFPQGVSGGGPGSASIPFSNVSYSLNSLKGFIDKGACRKWTGQLRASVTKILFPHDGTCQTASHMVRNSHPHNLIFDPYMCRVPGIVFQKPSMCLMRNLECLFTRGSIQCSSCSSFPWTRK